MNNNLKKILIIEDAHLFARQIVNQLEKDFNYGILLAKNLAQAEDILQKESKDIFLAVADLILPDAPQGEIIQVLENARIPTIIVTAEYNLLARKQMAEKPHIIDYILKDDPEFLTQCSRDIERWVKNQDCPALIADDSSTMRRILAGILKKQGFPLLQAEDGETALALIEERPDIRLLITDYNMPGRDGFDLTKEIRKRGRDKSQLIIIGISSEDNPQLAAQFLKMGANDFLQKPFSSEGLYRRIVSNLENLELIENLKMLNETKNRFIGMAAHDLRNPINGILGLSRLMKDSRGNNAISRLTEQEETHFLELITDSAEHMKNLVDDLLDVSVIEQGDLTIKGEAVDLTQLIRERIQFFKPMAKEKDQTIEESLEEITLALDKSRFTQVADNLISNAIKYSPKSEKISVALTLRKGQVNLAVCDRGPGIPEEERQELFSPFHRGSAQPTDGEKSTGLGLAISRKIVEAHGGTISVENRDQGGALFLVELPLP